uniref:Uncharacterized protein n=1 Tax=Arundo donax TaxID=35708 RepID=A0A0A8ZP57_ARUDO
MSLYLCPKSTYVKFEQVY